MSRKEYLKKGEDITVVQNHQMDSINKQIDIIEGYIPDLEETQSNNTKSLESIERDIQEMFKEYDLDMPLDSELLNADICDSLIVSEEETKQFEDKYSNLNLTNEIINGELDWEQYYSKIQEYATSNDIDLSRSAFQALMSKQQRIDFEKRLKENYAIKECHCDKYDYYIAGISGIIGGLIDIIFVGAPGDSILGNVVDDGVDKSVEKCAKWHGWKGPKKGSDSTKSAIGYLEQTDAPLDDPLGLTKSQKIKYDQRHTKDVDGKFNMSAKNHHLKSIGHSPSPIGLIFSIIDQFNSTSSFISDGQVITINTDNFELRGGNIIAKIFCGFVNWFWHLVSDVAGASGSKGRGAGIPICFYELTQFMNFGSIGIDKKTFSQVASDVFTEGYDFRHGLTMAIPVLTTELLIRFMWSMKSIFYHNNSLKESIPFGNIPELQRMLCVGQGTLCLCDLTDAGIRGGTNPVALLSHMNLVACVRFGHLGLKELCRIFKNDCLDAEQMEEDIDNEYKKLTL